MDDPLRHVTNPARGKQTNAHNPNDMPVKIEKRTHSIRSNISFSQLTDESRRLLKSNTYTSESTLVAATGSSPNAAHAR